VGGAIAEHVKTVEEAIRRELGSKASDLLPKIFQSLVIVNSEGLPTRRRPLLVEFPQELSPAVELLVRERLFHTEGEGEKSNVSISHEKLFDAWPALKEYVQANKRLLMDQTLLEMRARKWEAMGKPWFRGLAALPEVREFRRAGVPTVLGKEYLKASRRAYWLQMGLVVMSSIGAVIFIAILSGIGRAATLLLWYLVILLLVLFVFSRTTGRRPL